MDYAYDSRGSLASLNYNTQLLAKYYHDTRKVLKKVKLLLKHENSRVNHYLDAASDSDSVRSRTSSMDSDWQLNSGPFIKINKPCSKQSIEEEKQSIEEENEQSSSLSSADETDDESLNTKQVIC